MTDCSCLSCITTAAYINDHIEFICFSCCHERLANNNFQCFKTKILGDISFVDRDFTCSRYKIYSCE